MARRQRDQDAPATSHESRDHVGGEKNTSRRNTHEFKPRFPCLQRRQRAAHRRFKIALHDGAESESEHERYAEEGPGLLLWRKRRSRKCRGRHPDAVSPARDFIKLFDQRIKHHAESQIQHPEEDAAVSGDEEPDHEPDERRDGRGERQQHQSLRNAGCAERDDIGRQRQIERMTETHLPGAEQQQDAEHGQSLGEGNRHHEAQPRHRPGQGENEHGRKQRKRDIGVAAHIRRVSATAKRPCGRTSSTDTMMI